MHDPSRRGMRGMCGSSYPQRGRASRSVSRNRGCYIWRGGGSRPSHINVLTDECGGNYFPEHTGSELVLYEEDEEEDHELNLVQAGRRRCHR